MTIYSSTTGMAATSAISWSAHGFRIRMAAAGLLSIYSAYLRAPTDSTGFEFTAGMDLARTSSATFGPCLRGANLTLDMCVRRRALPAASSPFYQVTRPAHEQYEHDQDDQLYEPRFQHGRHELKARECRESNV